ncbi:MAG: HNH endonuclease signature motif containing protein, partial [Actinomycetes bacterium]
VGRACYPVTTAIWRGLVARDGGCAFAGCDRPPEWCEALHIIHWEDGGETSLANCCLLCDHHHRVVHHHGWHVELRDGLIWTIPRPGSTPTAPPAEIPGETDSPPSPPSLRHRMAKTKRTYDARPRRFRRSRHPGLERDLELGVVGLGAGHPVHPRRS